MDQRTSEAELGERLKPAVRVPQVIVVALTLGVAMFAIVALYVRLEVRMPAFDALTPILLPLGLLLAATALVAGRLLPALIVSRGRRAVADGTAETVASSGPLAAAAQLGDAGKLFGVYLNKTIVAAALFEGAAFVNLVAYMLLDNLIPLGVGIVMAGMIAVHFPTAPRVASWIVEQLRLIDDEKQLAR